VIADPKMFTPTPSPPAPPAPGLRILGLDLSLTCTGYATHRAVNTLQPPAKLRGAERLAWIRTALATLIANVHVVVLEGYAYGRAKQAHQLGELGGVVRLVLHDRGIPFVEVPPAVLKLYATGRGNASKEEMLVAAVKRLGYEGYDNNEADALWLYTFAADAYGTAPIVLPAAQRAALKKVTWPPRPKAVV